MMGREDGSGDGYATPHTPEQIIRKLREGERLIGEGQGLAEVCKHLEISEPTWHRWVAQYGRMRPMTRTRLPTRIEQLLTDNRTQAYAIGKGHLTALNIPPPNTDHTA